jgi:hypothetical protein
MFEKLPTKILKKITSYFQTEKTFNNECNEYELQERIKILKKHIEIKTDINTLSNLSMVSKTFKCILKDPKNITWTIYYNSLFPINEQDTYIHTSLCEEQNCNKITHYLKKDSKYSNIHKKIAFHHFNDLKNKPHLKDLSEIFGYHLTEKQIESYRKLKKI